jgi:hypothetical protein
LEVTSTSRRESSLLSVVESIGKPAAIRSVSAMAGVGRGRERRLLSQRRLIFISADNRGCSGEKEGLACGQTKDALGGKTRKEVANLCRGLILVVLGVPLRTIRFVLLGASLSFDSWRCGNGFS